MTAQTETLRLARDALAGLLAPFNHTADDVLEARVARGPGSIIMSQRVIDGRKALAAIDKELAEGDWRETVRDLYDDLITGKLDYTTGQDVVRNVVRIIENRHRTFFCCEVEHPQPVGPDQHADMIIELRLAWDEMEQLAPKPIPTIVTAALRCEDGIVYCLDAPARHHDVIRRLASTGVITAVIASCEQGFLTSDGRFVDRREAKRIAFTAGQLKQETHPTELFSEDVW
jgi:hypothetical protein